MSLGTRRRANRDRRQRAAERRARAAAAVRERAGGAREREALDRVGDGMDHGAALEVAAAGEGRPEMDGGRAWQEMAGPGEFLEGGRREGARMEEAREEIEERRWKRGEGSEGGYADMQIANTQRGRLRSADGARDSAEEPSERGQHAGPQFAETETRERKTLDPTNAKTRGWADDRPLGSERLAELVAWGASWRDAMEACGVSEEVVMKLMKADGFRDEVDEWRGQILDEAIGRLTVGAAEAADALRGLLRSEDEKMRYRAAQTLLRYLVALREQKELMGRIARLEREAAPGGAERRGNAKERVAALEATMRDGPPTRVRHDGDEVSRAIAELGLGPMIREFGEHVRAGNVEKALEMQERLRKEIERAPEGAREVLVRELDGVE